MSGYFLNSANLLKGSGVYCVYRCTHDSVNSKVSIKELIYIGESEDVSKRVSGHEKLAEAIIKNLNSAIQLAAMRSPEEAIKLCDVLSEQRATAQSNVEEFKLRRRDVLAQIEAFKEKMKKFL